MILGRPSRFFFSASSERIGSKVSDDAGYYGTLWLHFKPLRHSFVAFTIQVIRYFIKINIYRNYF